VGAQRPAATIAQTYIKRKIQLLDMLHKTIAKAYMMYNTPSVFCLISNTASGSWPPARALEKMVSRDSFGMAFLRVWLRAATLFAMVIWLIMLSSETDVSIGAIVVDWLDYTEDFAEESGNQKNVSCCRPPQRVGN
jgi:hypothetical protein